MPIKLITGQPGNGKTLYAVHLIHEAVKTGRPIYSNINGLDIDGVLPIPLNAKGELDWTMTEQGDEVAGTFGSLIVYDETQKLSYFAYKSKEKLSSNLLITKLEDHRHFAYDFIFITQSPKFLHLHLLELVNEHYHVKRPMNRHRAEIHLHRKACMQPEALTSQERAEDIFKFDYPHDLFKSYKSTQIVTNAKIRLPAYMKKLFWIVGLCGLGILYLFFFSDNFIFNHVKGEDSAKKLADTANVSDDKSNLLTEKNLTGEIALNTECRKGVNVEKPECVEWFNNLTKNNASIQNPAFTSMNQAVFYNPNKPFDDSEIQKKLHYEVTAKPVFSGCSKMNGRYVAYTQQGTILHDVSQSDCKLLLENNDRPFNYFVNNNSSSSNLSSASPTSISPVLSDQKEKPSLSSEDLEKFQIARQNGLI